MQVRWFRLCVDEAQLVGPQSNAGSMVEKITAVHRWGSGVGRWVEGEQGVCACDSCEGSGRQDNAMNHGQPAIGIW